MIHNISHAYWRNTLAYKTFHRMDIYKLVKTLGFFRLLIFLVISSIPIVNKYFNIHTFFMDEHYS